ncbi:MAG TPA: FlgO family outer membrane protein [Thermoanaerobaculia bacterium]|nr:FlgO family outer membrane protein [Thermoanaerobaculia bacterium]
MAFSLRSRLIAACVMLSAALSSPIYSQKILAEGIKDLATQIATHVSKEKKQKIAILPFRELDGKPTVLGTYVSEELVTDLFMIGGLDIVERTMLDRVLGEIKLGQTGVIDPETAKKVGKVAGVDAIVTGSITDLQSYVALNCRLIDAQTGHVFAAAQTKIVKDDDVRKIMGAALPSPGGDGDQPPPKKPVLQQQRAGNLLFELKGCSLSGKLVQCDFLITNGGEDVNAELFAHYSRLIDGDGNEYHGERVILGSSSGIEASTRLATGIPVRARLSFDGIPPETQQAKLLELAPAPTTASTIQFRNIPLTRP